MIWVIGSKGMLGTEVCFQLANANMDFCRSDSNVDITDFTALEDFVKEKKIDFVVNCAAYTAVDNAEDDEEKARKINADGARNIARLSKKIGAAMIHISTDYVFDGTKQFAYAEDNAVCPLGIYGATKAAGEKAVQEETDDFYILRTAWLYGFHGKNFVYTMIRAMKSRESVKVVSDQKGTPTNCATLAGVIVKILDSKTKIPCGIYHITDEGEATWFEFAKEIQRIAKNLDFAKSAGACKVNPCATADYPTKAKRPAYSVLSKAKIQTALKIKLPDWKDSLFDFLSSPFFEKSRIEN